MERLTYRTIKGEAMGNSSVADIGDILGKLAEYEDFEEIFRTKMTDTACEFLKDKEEFSKWLDRNKWIAKKCDEYARVEEKVKSLLNAHTDFSRETPEVNYELLVALFRILDLERDEERTNEIEM